MLKRLIVSCAAFATLALLMPSTSISATYAFTVGSADITAVLTGTATSVLEPGTSPLAVGLGGNFVDFDSGLGVFGTVTGLEITPAGTFTIDLDETIVGIDLMDVSLASLTNQLGAVGVVTNASGDFAIDTELTGTVTPPGAVITSLTGSAIGQLGLSGDTLMIALFGINIATFESLTTPGQFIDVKADFTFIGTFVPEPTTGLLMGLGLAGLASLRRRETV